MAAETVTRQGHMSPAAEPNGPRLAPDSAHPLTSGMGSGFVDSVPVGTYAGMRYRLAAGFRNIRR
jgi:hypothetical protein